MNAFCEGHGPVLSKKQQNSLKNLPEVIFVIILTPFLSGLKTQKIINSSLNLFWFN